MIQIPLNELKPAKNNVRQVKTTKESIKSLAASIESQGMLHNLVIKKNGKGYEVIDGNRRLEALRVLYGAKASNEINCIVIEDNDNEIGLHANMMREDMHPLDESDVIYDIVAEGQEDFDSVGKRFGQTKQWVKQRLALSSLSLKAKAKFRNYDFGLGVAIAFTLGSHEQQDKFLDDHENAQLSASWVKDAMTDSKIPASKALFQWEGSHLEEELGVQRDLFSEEVFFTNREAFEECQMNFLQDFINLERQTKDFMDVVFLKDEYWFDSPATKGYSICHDDEVPDSDCILCVMYNTYQMKFLTQRMVSDEQQEQSQLEASPEEEEEELSPITYTKPQKSMLHGYYAHETKVALWHKANKNDLTKFMMAMFCHRSLGWTYSMVDRIGNCHADHQRFFPVDEEPDNYVVPEHETFIEEHKEAAKLAYEEQGIIPLKYCLDLERQILSRLFSAICLTTLSNYDIQSETFQENSPAIVDWPWFRPDYKWLNKYKSAQLDMLSDYLLGKVISGSKRDKIEAIKQKLDTSPEFDPYGEWPQYKQSSE